MFQAKYLCGAARLPHHPRSSFPLRLGLLVPDWSLEPKTHRVITQQPLQLHSALACLSKSNSRLLQRYDYMQYIITLFRTCACLHLACWGSRRGRPWSEGWAGLWPCGWPCPAPSPRRPLPLESGRRRREKKSERFRCVKTFKET